MNQPGPSVDDLRARLRELGYLDAGVDRFVLGSAGPARSLVGLAALSSLRIGLLAALVFGPLSALALAAWLPSLVVGPGDGFLLGVYLAVLFGCGATVLAFAATLLMAALGAGFPRVLERPGDVHRLAQSAGVAVGVATLVYLVLYWRTSGPLAGGWPRAMWTVLVLAAAAGVSVLLGHAAALTTLVAVTYRRPEIQATLERRRRSWRSTAAAGLLAFVGGAALLAATGPPRVPEERAPAGRARFAATRAARLTVVAIDGFDVRFAERMSGAGRIPSIQQVLAGPRLELAPSDAQDPARTWTSIATGQPPDVHGVAALEARRVSGMEGTVPGNRSSLAATLAAATDLIRLTHPTAASGLERRVKTFWEVASEGGLRVVVGNWWATWPAPQDGSTILTDRAVLRLERGGALDGEIAPAALYPPLRQAWPAVRDEARRRAVSAFPDPLDPVDGVLRRAAEQDLIQAGLLLRVLPGPPDAALGSRLANVDLLVVYFPGLDIAQYSLLTGPAAAGLPPSALAARVQGLERYYVFLDGVIAPFLAAGFDGSPDRAAAIVADPGRSSGNGRGLLALAGGAARGAGSGGLPAPASEARIPDVMPTLLYGLGLPISRELPGTARASLFAPSFQSRVRVAYVDSYGRRTIPRATGGEAPLDREAIERLRSLGYIR
jgi:hypothetical protein